MAKQKQGNFYLKNQKIFMVLAGLLAVVGLLVFVIFNLQWAKISQKMGMNLEKLLIVGNKQIPNNELLNAMHLQPGDAILSINIDDIKARLELLGWVKTVAIERVLPNTLVVKLQERTPDALYEKDGKLYLMDGEGVLLAQFNPEYHDQFRPNLRVVRGVNAEKHYKTIYAVIDADPVFAQMVNAVAYISERRWDLFINYENFKVKVQLPEQVTPEMIKKLDKLIRIDNILSKKISVIDLRDDKNIILKMDDGTEHNKGLI